MLNKNEFCKELKLYIIGFSLSVALTASAFWAVLGMDLSVGKAMSVIGILGVTQLIIQVRTFLHIDGKCENREDLYLILFSTLILLIMILGTVWILGNLEARMHMDMISSH